MPRPNSRKAKQKKEQAKRQEEILKAAQLHSAPSLSLEAKSTIKPTKKNDTSISPRPRFKDFRKTFFDGLAIIGFFIAVVSIYFQFNPWISVEPISDSSTGIFTDTKFRITNESPIPIYNVSPAFTWWDGERHNARINVYSIALNDDFSVVYPHVSIAEKLVCNPYFDPEKNETVYAENVSRPMIQCQVDYCPYGIKFLKTHISRLFWAYKNKTTGLYVWVPVGGGADIGSNNPPPYLLPER